MNGEARAEEPDGNADTPTTLERAIHTVNRALLFVGCLFLVAMMLHITADVIARTNYDRPMNYWRFGTIVLD